MIIMLGKFLRAISFAVLSIVFISSIFFTGTTKTDALIKGWSPPDDETLSSEVNGDNPLRLVIEPSVDDSSIENKISMDEMSENKYPDLGSEQVFPFEPGLGNSAF